MQITDSHVQFWNPETLYYPWLKNQPHLNRQVTPSELPASGDGWTVAQLVAIEAEGLPEQWRPEVEWFTKLSKQDTRIKGIVAFVPLENHNFHAMLTILEQMPLVKGVRRTLRQKRDALIQEETFLDTIRNLADYKFSFDLDARIDQADAIVNMVQVCPEVMFALNGLVYDESDSPDDDALWLNTIQRLGTCENLYCKTSALTAGRALQPDKLAARKDALLEAFTPNRLMYSSHFPHSFTGTQTYEGWITDIKAWLTALSTEEQDRIFFGNGVQFYKLSES